MNLSDKLVAIFKKNLYTELHEILERGCAFPSEFQGVQIDYISHPKTILFLGINPAFDKNEPVQRIEKTTDDENDLIKIPTKAYTPKIFQKINDEEDIRYFESILELIKKAEIPIERCAYTDLFYFRETSQKKIQELLKTETGVGFLIDQLIITDEFIKEVIRPRIIIPLNSQACNFLGLKIQPDNTNIWMGYKTKELDEILCAHIVDECVSDIEVIKNRKFHTQPVIIPSSILRYQSQGNIDRLSWVIKRCYNILKENKEFEVRETSTYKTFSDLKYRF